MSIFYCFREAEDKHENDTPETMIDAYSVDSAAVECAKQLEDDGDLRDEHVIMVRDEEYAWHRVEVRAHDVRELSACETEDLADYLEHRPGPCAHCGKPATCFGKYESNTALVQRACDDCCAHGNEDGWCKPYEAGS